MLNNLIKNNSLMSKIEQNWFKLFGYLEGRKFELETHDNSTDKIRLDEIKTILNYIKRISYGQQ